MNLNIPGTIFLLITFSNIKKAYLRISKYLAQFFCSSLFQVVKKAYLRIWKYLTQFFCSSLFRILKRHTYEPQNTWHNFFAHTFSNIKKNIQISKYLTQIFCLHWKKHTYKSQNTLFILIIILKATIYIKTIIQTILIKTIIQIDKHKVKYTITACIPKLL